MAWGPASLQALREAKAETEKQGRAERKERSRRVGEERSGRDRGTRGDMCDSSCRREGVELL